MADPTSVDVLFSMQRWLGMLLPEPWDIQPTRTEGQRRPAGTVQPINVATETGSAYVRDTNQPYEIFLWPEGVENRPMESRMAAERLRDTLRTALGQGFVTTDGYRAYSLRVPWYDYEAIDTSTDYPPDAAPEGYLVLARNYTVEARKDPEQDDLFTVIVSLTVETRMQGDTSRFQGKVLQDVRVNFTA